MENNKKINIVYVPIKELKLSEYNPRKHSNEEMDSLIESIKRFDIVDPVIANNAPERNNVLIGGHMRVLAMRKIGMKEAPVVFLNIPDLEKEKELNIRLNRGGSFDWNLLSSFDEEFLKDIGFTSEELDSIFEIEDKPEEFDLDKELNKLNIKNIEIKKGDVWQIGDAKLACGDSTIEEDMMALMDGEKADMVFTDPPYILSYLRGKTRQKDGVTEGFGAKRNRRYLETDVLPDDFTEKWMNNISKIAKDDFHIIVYENWKNIRTIWGEMEKHWKVKNMIVWHLPNRNQGFAAKYKLFSKHDIAMVGSSPEAREMNMAPEEELLQNEYETALYAISGKPQWEGYEKGKKYQPTDFIEYKVADEKSSGQGIIFGTKPLEILIPYIKVLTKRGDLIVEPFGGSGSTCAAALRMKRRCNIMEKSPVYAEVIRNRIEKLTGLKAVKIHERKLQTNN